MKIEAVLDSSALLALINGEPGGELVADIISAAVVSAVNFAEVLTKLTDRGIAPPDIRAVMSELPIETVPFDQRQAWLVRSLRPATYSKGLSLADNVCLALAQSLGQPAWTADRIWADLDINIRVQLIR